MPEEEFKNPMRTIQTRQTPQTTFADSLDPRQATATQNHNNDDLAYNRVYNDRSKVIVDFG